MVVRRRAAWLRGWVAAVLIIPLLAVSAAGRASAGSIDLYVTAGAVRPLAGEVVEFRGAVPGHLAYRPYFVQHRAAADRPWVTHQRIRPDTWGRFTFSVETSRRVGVQLKTRVVGWTAGSIDKTLVSKAVGITTVEQHGELQGPRAGHLGTTYRAVAEVRPVREGRTLALQRLDGETWVTVDTLQQGAEPRVELDLPVEGLGEQVHRLRARPFHASRPFSTDTVTVIGRDDSPEGPLPVRRTVSAGDAHVCDLLDDGVARCWGANSDRRLGSETASRTHGRFPVEVEGDRRWADIDTGAESTCGITRDGELWCWGAIASEPDDDDWGTPTVANPPVRIGDARDWRSVDLGGNDACGMRANATVWCWTTHQQRIEGGGPYVARVPTQLGWFDDWEEIAVGESHVCGLRTGGTLWCQGSNELGQLGVGKVVDRVEPVRPDPVPVGSDRWRTLAAAPHGTCGVRLDGSLWCWGETGHTNGMAPAETPQRVGDESGWAQVTASEYDVCARDTDESAACLGWASRGGSGLSRGSTQARFTDVTLGEEVGCGVDTAGTTQCWGMGHLTGDGAPQRIDPVPRRLGIPAGWDSWVSQGDPWYLCALREDATAACWGAFDVDPSRIEDGTFEPGPFGGDRTWKELAWGEDHACGVSTDGALFCWGGNGFGQLGQGITYGSAATPTRVGDRTDWTRVVSADRRSCALREDGSLWCWGRDVSVPPGPGVPAAVPTPRRVGDESTTWLDVHIDSWATACAVRSDHTLWCWGYNHHGQLGIGVQDAPEDPPRQMTQVGSDTDWAEVRVAVPVTCAIKVDRSLWCWGANNNGQSGSGASEEPATSPRRVAGEREWADVTPSGAFVCGTTTDARAWCWGGNARGSLGDGTLDDRTEPTAVMGEHRWRDLTVTGTAATCGIDTDGALWCWGPHQGYFGNVVRRREPAPVGPTTPSP